MRRVHVARITALLGAVSLLAGCAWIRQADVSLTGSDANSLTMDYWLSSNGRYVYFNSGATNLVPETAGMDPSENFRGIFRRDNKTGKTALVRRNAALFAPSAVSRDLQVLLIGDGAPDFASRVWDRAKGTVEPFEVDSAERPLGGTLKAAALSADGRFVAFRQERVGDLATFVRDLQIGTTRQVTTTLEQADNTWLGYYGGSDPLSISRDGSVVSVSTCLRSEFTSRTPTCLEWGHELVDVPGGTVSRPLANQTRAFASRISEDGRILAYWDGQYVRTYNRVSGARQLVSVDKDGQPAPGGASSISANGRYVTFDSVAGNIVDPLDVTRSTNVYVRDRARGVTTLASATVEGERMRGFSFGGLISADGRYVSFRHAGGPTSTDPVIHWGVFTKSVAIPRITDVSPDSGFHGTNVHLTIAGYGFRPDAEIVIGRNGHALFTASVVITETSIELDVALPLGTPIGDYDVTVANPGGTWAHDSGAAANCVGCFTVT